MNFPLLKKLSEARGVSGFEDEIRAVIAAELKPCADELAIDVMGNLVARKKGKGKHPRKVMISAHIDEIGFLVRHIDDNGFLRLDTLGGIYVPSLPGRTVTVCGKKPLPGVIGARALGAITDEQKNKTPDLEEIYVDLGLPADAVKKVVEIGTPVTMRQECLKLGNLVCGKAMDNRAGVFCMLETARNLRHSDFEIYYVATTQEEVGLRGAATCAYAISPDFGIALDVTRANDVPGVAPHKHVATLGKGVAVKIKDAGSLGHPGLIRHLRELAEQAGIPYQLEVLPQGSTDGAAMQRARAGIPAVTLSIPTRHIHSTVEICHPDDINAAVALLKTFLEHGAPTGFKV